MNHFKKFFPVIGLFFLFVVVSLVSCASGEWPVFRHDIQHVGYSREYSSYQKMDLIVFWNFSANSSFYSPVTGDLDSDGVEEIVFGSDSGMVYALRSNGSLFWSYRAGGAVKSAPTVWNLSRGGFLQVVFGSTDGSVYALDYNGSLLWKFKTNGSVTSSPVIVDIVNGPKPGVVFGSSDGNIYILHNDGGEFWHYSFRSPITHSPAILDIDGNGVKDIAFSSGTRLNVVSLSPFKIITTDVGSEVTTSPVVEGGDIIVGTDEGSVYKFSREVVDVNESVISTRSDRILWLNRSKEIEVLTGRAFFNCSKRVLSTPSFADLDLNPKNGREYVFGCDDGNLYILHHWESNNTRVIRYTTSKPVRSSPALVDLNNDTDMEIVFGSDDGGVYVINSTGFGRWAYKHGARISASPAVSDLDGDDFVEIVIGTSDGVLYCLGSNTSVLKSEGRRYYDIARDLFIALDFENSTEFGLKALEVYAGINYSKGIEDVNLLFLDISAKEHCLKAVDFYERELFNDSLMEVEMANLVYFEARRSSGSECDYLLPVVKSHVFYEEALSHVNRGLFEKARWYASEANNLSIQTADSIISSKSLVLLERVRRLEEAQKLFSQAVKDHFDNITLVDVLGRLKQAEKVYDDNNASYVFSAMKPLMQSIESEIYVRNMTVLLDKGMFKEAYDLAVKTRELCMKSKNTDCIAKSENVINETYMHVEAGDLLAKARRYYTATDFITASEYASKARDLYKTLGDGEKALESEEILNKSLSMLEGGYGGRGLFGNVPKLVVIALFAEVVLLVLVVVTRPKTRTWFRGLVGLGRSASGFRVGVSRLGGNVTRPVKRDVKPKAVEEKLFK